MPRQNAPHFRGACHRDANWISHRSNQWPRTQRRGLQPHGQAIKDIFVYADARRSVLLAAISRGKQIQPVNRPCAVTRRLALCVSWEYVAGPGNHVPRNPLLTNKRSGRPTIACSAWVDSAPPSSRWFDSVPMYWMRSNLLTGQGRCITIRRGQLTGTGNVTLCSEDHY